MSQISQLSVSLSLSLSLHQPSLPVIRPLPSLPQFPVPQQPNCCLDALVTKAHFYHFVFFIFSCTRHKQRNGNVHEKAWRTLFTLLALVRMWLWWLWFAALAFAVQTYATLHTLEPYSSHVETVRSVWSWSAEIFEEHTHTQIPCFYREMRQIFKINCKS